MGFDLHALGSCSLSEWHNSLVTLHREWWWWYEECHNRRWPFPGNDDDTKMVRRMGDPLPWAMIMMNIWRLWKTSSWRFRICRYQARCYPQPHSIGETALIPRGAWTVDTSDAEQGMVSSEVISAVAWFHQRLTVACLVNIAYIRGHIQTLFGGRQPLGQDLMTHCWRKKVKLTDSWRKWMQVLTNGDLAHLTSVVHIFTAAVYISHAMSRN